MQSNGSVITDLSIQPSEYSNNVYHNKIVFFPNDKTGSTDIELWDGFSSNIHIRYHFSSIDIDNLYTFTVFRDPIERFVSLYNFNVFGNNENDAHFLWEMTMDEFIHLIEENKNGLLNMDILREKSQELALFFDNDDLQNFMNNKFSTQQSKFLPFDKTTFFLVLYEREQNRNVVEFLKTKFDLDVIPHDSSNSKVNVSKQIFDVTDLTEYHRQFINEYYKDDIDLFDKIKNEKWILYNDVK